MADKVVPAGTEHAQALHALTRKYAEISGRIDHHRTEIERLSKDMIHLRRVIEIFGPDIQVQNISPKNIIVRPVVAKGKITQNVLEIMRENKNPQSPRELTLALMSKREMNIEDPILFNVMLKRVRACLRMQRRRGVLAPIQVEGVLQRWSVVL